MEEEMYTFVWRKYAVAAAVAIAAASGTAFAQENYPNKPIRIIVPYTAGGGVDTVARLIGDKMSKTLGQPVIVDNKPGASGMIGATAVAKSPPDGYTLLLSAAGEIAVNPSLYKGKMQYDPQKDLAPISLVVRIPNVLVVNPDVPAKTTAELVAYAKANPGKLSYSSSGVGNPQHLNGELFNKIADVQTSHVPYKGAAQQLTDVTAKHVSMTFTSVAAALPFIKNGQIRPIAVTSSKRVSSLPDVPTLELSRELLNQLAPTGRIRAAINYGHPVLAQKGSATGEPRGVSADIARELSRRVGIDLMFVTFDAAGKVFAALAGGAWDVAFLAIDPTRAKEIDFTAPYVIIEGTYMVPADSAIMVVEDVDRSGIRIAVGAGSAYDLFLTRTIKHAQLVRAPTGPEAIDVFLRERLEAAAGVKSPLQRFAKNRPHVRVLGGRFMVIEQAMAVPKGRAAALRYVRQMLEELKSSGFVAAGLARSGQDDAVVAAALGAS
jgi:tripartite-type tricarboxylate transporter receptor subunit TctC